MARIINNAHNGREDDDRSRDNNGSSSSSESITLRFDKATIDELRDEANQKMESVNTLLNQIVKAYIRWHKPAKISGLIYINKFLYRDIVEQLPEEKVKTISENYASHYFMDVIEMFDGVPSVSYYIKYLLMWLEMSGFNYRIVEENPNYMSIKIQLDLGIRFSEFIASKIESILESLNQPEAKIEATDHLVIVRISKSVS